MTDSMSKSSSYRRRQAKQNAKVAEAAELVIPCGMWSRIHEYLFKDTSREYACYLLCGHAWRGNTLRLLGCFLVLPEAADYVSHSLASVHLKQSLLAEILRECSRLGLSLVDLHSHPFAKDTVSFSGVDETDEREKAAWFAEQLPRCYYGSVVLGQESHAARLRSADGRMVTEGLVVRTLDVPLRTSSGESTGSTGTMGRDIGVERHVRAFGAEGQSRLLAAHVGIVGLGGLGSGLALGLARLGVRRFTLVDEDRAEPHNLNRLFGMKASDGHRRLRKTHLIRRELRGIAPEIDCRVLSMNVLERRAWSGLLDCDLIMAVTDNHSSRMLLNTLTEQYFIPQVSVGSLIETEEGQIKSACGHVRVLLPGPHRPCLLCSEIVNPAEVYYERVPVAYRREAVRRGYIINFEEPAPAVVHLNGVLIHLALVEVHNLFCGFKETVPYLFYDMLGQELLHIQEPAAECATCSPSGIYFGRGDLVDLGEVFNELLPK